MLARIGQTIGAALGKRGLSWSLKTRVSVLTLTAFLLAVWSLTRYATRTLREDMTHLLGEQQFSTTSPIAAQINAELDGRLRALGRWGAGALTRVARQISPDLLTQRAALQRFLEQRTTFQSPFNGGTRIRDADARTLASVPHVAEQIGRSYAERDDMLAALGEDRARVGRPMISQTLRSLAITLAAPLRDSGGSVIGALTGVIDLGQPSFFGRTAEQRHGGDGGYLIIAPQHALIVTGTDKSRSMSPMPAPASTATTTASSADTRAMASR